MSDKFDPWTCDEETNTRMDPHKVLRRLQGRLRLVKMLAESCPASVHDVRILETRIAAQKARIAKDAAETERVRRRECHRWIHLFRRHPWLLAPEYGGRVMLDRCEHEFAELRARNGH